MQKLIILMLCLGSFGATAQDSTELAIDSTLTKFHQAAAAGDWGVYFGLLADNAIFLGTDASERWSKTEFEQYAKKTSGWIYNKQERHITLSADGQTAWFDELLWNEGLGLCRGSGVLVKLQTGWLISQYNLSIPIPNTLARDIAKQIKQQDLRP